MKETFSLDEVAKATGAVRAVLQAMEQERWRFLVDLGRVRDLENPQKDAILTAMLRGKVQLLEQWIARLAPIGYTVDGVGKSLANTGPKNP